jgi:hypothetical protein
MKNLSATMAVLSLTMFAATYVPAEEVSGISDSEISRIYNNQGITIPTLVRGSDFAGVGVFSCDTTTNNVPYADIHVQEWWTPSPGTNVVRVHNIQGEPAPWTFPTNVPVVFFAATKAEWYGTYAEHLLPNESERAELTFISAERSWFRLTRDSGLLHTFTTNLWDCVRANPNPTYYYEVLRDAERTVSRQDSWRVSIDASYALSWLFDDASEAYLAEKLNDPLLSPVMRHSVGNRLWDKFGWTYTVIDNTVQWHPPQ